MLWETKANYNQTLEALPDCPIRKVVGYLPDNRLSALDMTAMAQAKCHRTTILGLATSPLRYTATHASSSLSRSLLRDILPRLRSMGLWEG